MSAPAGWDGRIERALRDEAPVAPSPAFARRVRLAVAARPSREATPPLAFPWGRLLSWGSAFVLLASLGVAARLDRAIVLSRAEELTLAVAGGSFLLISLLAGLSRAGLAGD